ncbi:unnamed protein product [Brassicogethes aeneus]|uniref:Uncharacterized protein n=1 Tax=Brassicogethes aeneus TaxID=1431903 RepID=A0A9P0FGK5_BRAAE|nr:unnamed protein product [Brassicogethes aeneus]
MKKTAKSSTKGAKTSNSELDSRVNAIDSKLTDGISALKSELTQLKQKGSKSAVNNYDYLQKRIEDFEAEMKSCFNELKLAIEKNSTENELFKDKYFRNIYGNSLIFHGIKNNSGKEDLQKEMCNVIATYNLMENFTPSNINYCYRMSAKNNVIKTTTVVVNFVNKWVRDSIFQLKRNLKGSKIFIAEMLTKDKLDLLTLVKEKFEAKQCWTYNGEVFVLKNNQKTKITCETDVYKILDIDTENEKVSVNSSEDENDERDDLEAQSSGNSK